MLLSTASPRLFPGYSSSISITDCNETIFLDFRFLPTPGTHSLLCPDQGPSYAERAWDYYTKTGTLTRDLALSDLGLRRVFETQVKAGLLPPSLSFDLSKYVAGGYLERARASLPRAP